MNIVERVLFVAGGIMMVTTSLTFNGAGAAVLAGVIFIQRKKKNTVSATA